LIIVSRYLQPYSSDIIYITISFLRVFFKEESQPVLVDFGSQENWGVAETEERPQKERIYVIFQEVVSFEGHVSAGREENSSDCHTFACICLESRFEVLGGCWVGQRRRDIVYLSEVVIDCLHLFLIKLSYRSNQAHKLKDLVVPQNPFASTPALTEMVFFDLFAIPAVEVTTLFLHHLPNRPFQLFCAFQWRFAVGAASRLFVDQVAL
jgi:hypothetical protein